MRTIISLFIIAGIEVAGMAAHQAALAAEKQIAVLWVGKSGMTQRVLKGFLPRVKQIAPEMKITVKMELPDMETAEKLFRQYETEMDGIVFLRSSGAEFLGKANPKVPCFVGGANNPKELGAIENLDSPEGRITGVTYYIPYDKRIAAIKSILPDAKSVGLLLRKGHPSTPLEQRGTREQCEKLGMEYHEVVAADVDELVKGAQSLAGKVHALIMGFAEIVVDNTARLVPVSHAARVPLFAYAEHPVKDGALAGLVARDEVLGQMLADSVVDVVVKGKPVSQVPVKTDPKPQLFINEAESQFFGLKLTPDVLRDATIVRKQ